MEPAGYGSSYRELTAKENFMKLKQMVLFVWMGSLLTKALYVFIATTRYHEVYTKDFSMFLSVMILIGVACLAGSFFLTRALYSSQRLYEGKRYTKTAHYTDSLFSKHEATFFSTYVITQGLVETCALFGLTGFLQSGNVAYLSAMVGGSFIGWIFTYPRIDRFEEFIKELDSGVKF